jgi:hypothetical protein
MSMMYSYSVLIDKLCVLANWTHRDSSARPSASHSGLFEPIARLGVAKGSQDTYLSRPILRESIADLSRRALAILRDGGAGDTRNDAATADQVAGSVEDRTSSMLRNFKWTFREGRRSDLGVKAAADAIGV